MTLALLRVFLLAGMPLYSQTPAEVDAYLEVLQRDKPDYLARFSQVVRDCEGTPYQDGPLGEGPEGAYDTDPLIDLTRVDCVTYVEQCVALAAGTDFADVTDKLQRVRYAGGHVDYGARNHFMVADWIPNNPWCRDVTKDLELSTAPLTRDDQQG